CPPTRADASSTVTSCPLRDSSKAQERPAIPAPPITTFFFALAALLLSEGSSKAAAETLRTSSRRVMPSISLERKAPYQLNAARCSHRSVPHSKGRATKVVVERQAFASSCSIACEVVVIQQVACIRTELEAHPFVDQDLLCNRKVHILIPEPAIVRHAFSSAEIVLEIAFE